MRRVALQLAADGAPHAAAGSVAADDIVCAHRDLFARPFKRDRDGMIRRVLIHGQVAKGDPVVRRQPRRRVSHHIQKQLMNARLVHQRMRHLGLVVGDILNDSRAVDMGRAFRVRRPERRLVDPIRFAPDLLGEAEGLKHLHRPDADAVGLPFLDRPRFLLHDHGGDVGKSGKLGREAETGGAATDDKNVDLRREDFTPISKRAAGRGGHDVRIAWAKPVHIILHRSALSRSYGHSLDIITILTNLPSPLLRRVARSSETGRSG